MPNIRILPDRVANQIAAGEVIERPAAVVKELVENALDAGATRLEVEFRHGGRSLMRVEDNGHGMTRDDALLSLERHATSKIAEADDLNRLATFGFRGEALPSIASVSRFLLQTRRAESDLGTEVLVNGGRLVHVRECGRPIGSRIEVTHLFNSVPARRKFLKTDTTESAHIIQCVRLYALAFPAVSFTLIEEGRIIFRSPPCSALHERVTGIFGRQVAESLVTLESIGQGMRLTGLIGQPGQGRATRHEMITFINQRPVDSRTLNYALIESFHESLPKGRYPVAFVFFEIDPASVDVNVHPSKREVRFRSESTVRAFIIRAVLGRLRELREILVPSVSTGAALLPATPPPKEQASLSAPRHEILLPRPSPPPALSWAMAGIGPPFVAKIFPPQLSAPTDPPLRADPLPIRPADFSSWRFLGLAHASYALFETAAGLVLLDRRGAHERVWFERLQWQFRSGAIASQRLLLPVPVELDPIATALLLERLAFLNEHGFEVVEFGRCFFRIEAVPAWMEPADAEPFLRDLLAALREGRLQGKSIDLAREEFARLAVLRAIRLPEKVSQIELESLVRELFASKSPLTSPGGRPTFIELSHGELTRRFQK